MNPDVPPNYVDNHRLPADPMASWVTPRTKGEVWVTRICVAIMMLSLLVIFGYLLWDIVGNTWKPFGK